MEREKECIVPASRSSGHDRPPVVVHQWLALLILPVPLRDGSELLLALIKR
jgi:hypothetical protein